MLSLNIYFLLLSCPFWNQKAECIQALKICIKVLILMVIECFYIEVCYSNGLINGIFALGPHSFFQDLFRLMSVSNLLKLCGLCFQHFHKDFIPRSLRSPKTYFGFGSSRDEFQMAATQDGKARHPHRKRTFIFIRKRVLFYVSNYTSQ